MKLTIPSTATMFVATLLLSLMTSTATLTAMSTTTATAHARPQRVAHREYARTHTPSPRRRRHVDAYGDPVYIDHNNSVKAMLNESLLLPPTGWSSWNVFRFAINDTMLRQMADAMTAPMSMSGASGDDDSSSGSGATTATANNKSSLLDAGYDYLLIDDGWSLCLAHDPKTKKCTQPAPRDDNGNLPVDARRFPHGMAALVDYVHARGLKIGIYTAVSSRTCGGYWGSLGYEQLDAAQFVAWGFDFVKHDTCNSDCGVHDGCMQLSTAAMAHALYTSGRDVVYYLDAGNPTSTQRVWAGTMIAHDKFHVKNAEVLRKVAQTPAQAATAWAPPHTHMLKTWFDRDNTWESFLTNIHHQASTHMAMRQRCGRFNMPGMLTVGQSQHKQRQQQRQHGHALDDNLSDVDPDAAIRRPMTASQEQAQFYLYCVLGAPLIVGLDVRRLSRRTHALLTNPETLLIARDPGCYQGMMVRSEDSGEVWIRALSDGSYGVVLLNKSARHALNISVAITVEDNWSDFYPATIHTMEVRDAGRQRDVGLFQRYFTQLIAPMSASIFIFKPMVGF